MNCPICGASGIKQAFERDAIHVWRCADCGAEHLSPQPSDAALERIYSGSYFFRNDSAQARERRGALKSATAQLYLDTLHADHPPTHGARLLEIGCGTGDFLAEASSHGYDVTGVEISRNSATLAAQRIAAGRVFCGTLESAGFANESFDVVANIDVIEHVRDPIAFLREVHRVLVPGGTLLLVTPSLDSLARRLLGRWWMEYKTEHLYYFGARSLERALRQTGFSDPHIAHSEKVLSLDYVAAHFEHFPIPLLTPLVAALTKLVPSGIAHRPIRLMASGMAALVRKGA